MSTKKNLEGIRGWLLLVAIGVVVSPVRIMVLIMTTYPEILTSGVWEVLTVEGNDAYHPLWAPILTAEIIFNSALVLAWLYTAYLFFSRRRNFPKWYIGIVVFSLALIIGDAFAIKLVLPDEPVFDPETLKDVARSASMVLIWVPYMLVSKRVRATFIK